VFRRSELTDAAVLDTHVCAGTRGYDALPGWFVIVYIHAVMLYTQLAARKVAGAILIGLLR